MGALSLPLIILRSQEMAGATVLMSRRQWRGYGVVMRVLSGPLLRESSLIIRRCKLRMLEKVARSTAENRLSVERRCGDDAGSTRAGWCQLSGKDIAAGRRHVRTRVAWAS